MGASRRPPRSGVPSRGTSSFSGSVDSHAERPLLSTSPTPLPASSIGRPFGLLREQVCLEYRRSLRVQCLSQNDYGLYIIYYFYILNYVLCCWLVLLSKVNVYIYTYIYDYMPFVAVVEVVAVVVAAAGVVAVVAVVAVIGVAPG